MSKSKPKPQKSPVDKTTPIKGIQTKPNPAAPKRYDVMRRELEFNKEASHG